MDNKRVLRPIEKRDLEKLNRWKNDESVFKFLGGGYKPVSVDQQASWMDNMMDLNGNNKRFMILDENGDAIGMTGLYSIDWTHRTCEVGLYIGESSARRKGFALMAYFSLEKYAKNYLNLRKIKLNVVRNNNAGKKLWDKVGFKEVGVLHQERYINGEYCDLIIMEKFIK